ncbi:MAG: prepilin-type N-terminal cleavage/methylation domain-containing protein [Elusimicrobia bacterium]|nr:prepilin-type N-terminal cleavage/methylation domain-containing protein [Elusimicrobiota bacterium]
MRQAARRREAGFTIMELMIVLAIIAMIAAFALPKFGKSVGKTNITNAFQTLASLSGQVEAVCASKNSAPTADQVNALIDGAPNGYSAATVSGGCSDFKISFAAATAKELPTLCAYRDSGQWKFDYGLVESPFTDADIPIPSSKYKDGGC